ncbi:rod shape-determining protein RodA [SAR92 clade bacterium H921]|jgi:rod shape determining protein RodA|nr:rod shape-determining protein RodA [SAR92 clade bacterium H921]
MYRDDFVRRMQDSGIDRRRGRSLHIDLPLLAILITLCGVGLIVLYSASGQNLFYVKRQALLMLVGFGVMFGTAQFAVRFWQRWSIALYMIGLFSLVIVLFFGVGAKGAQRWLDLGITRFQPSELMKVAVPLMVSAYLGRHYIPPTFKHVLIVLVITIIPVLLVARQPDLGTAILIFASGFFVIFLAGLRKRYLATAFFLALAAIPTLWIYVLHDYQKQRVLTLLSPQDDKLGAGWNIIQSTTAIGSGGWSGKGWTQGTQSQLNFLPESHTDFIIAVLAEEFGFVGVLSLCALYALLIGRCMLIAINSQSHFGHMIAGSLSLTFFTYIFVNMSMVSGILPVVGVPLPFISYGGTAIVTLFLGFGILMAISTEPRRIRTDL